MKQSNMLQKNGAKTRIKSLSANNDRYRNYDRYDNQIIGWTNYWNNALKGTLNFKKNVVKALMFTESKMGYYFAKDRPSANAQVDVMQVLDGRNPAVQRMAACGNYDPNEGAAYGMPRSGYGILKTLYPKGTYNKTYATVDMSIAFGIRWLAFNC